MAFRTFLIRLLSRLLLLSFFSGCQVLRNLDIFSSGQQGVHHTVLKGQTLYAIAQAYAIDVNRLKRANGIWDPAKLQVGTRLWIPGARRVLEVGSTDRKSVAAKKKRSGNSKPRQTVKAVQGLLTWQLKRQLTSRF
ncbi:MAG: LysM peptidoglycan-binding domain-containing protein, partial [Nitrospinae bacterium]|nr:LysM peptidoglycan-binding domain-containing protein [Nitrospinota bacterium]